MSAGRGGGRETQGKEGRRGGEGPRDRGLGAEGEEREQGEGRGRRAEGEKREQLAGRGKREKRGVTIRLGCLPKKGEGTLREGSKERK